MDLNLYFTSNDLIGIIPEIILTMTALFVLSLDFIGVKRPGVNVMSANIGLLLSGFFVNQGGHEGILFGGMLHLSSFSVLFDFIYIGIGIATLLISNKYLVENLGKIRGEFPALVLFSVIGMMLMTRANDLVVLFLGLELLSLSLYVLVGFHRHNLLSNESGLKYLFLGAFSTGFFLFGVAMIYGATGTTNYNELATAVSGDNLLSELYLTIGIGLLLVSFGFKVALVPFHMWSPDVYQGAPTSITAFLCTAPKAAGFGALLKLFLISFSDIQGDWKILFWLIAVLTMTIGNISALVQNNVKRMLAFSSVSHAGVLLIGLLVFEQVGFSAVIFYLIVYSVMNFGAFAIILMVEKDERGLHFEDYRGFASKHPAYALAMVLFMISLAGIPPTGGFIAKFGILSSAVSEGYIWLVVIAVLNTLISAFYYVRLIVNMYMEQEENVLDIHGGGFVFGLVGTLGLFILFIGIAPGFLLEFTKKTITGLF